MTTVTPPTRWRCSSKNLEGQRALLMTRRADSKPLTTTVPDFVFLDIGMPGIDGYETCRQMRRRPSNKAMVIIAVTGWGQPQDKQRALDAGFDAHLTKPVEFDALARILPAARPDRSGELPSPAMERGPATFESVSTVRSPATSTHQPLADPRSFLGRESASCLCG